MGCGCDKYEDLSKFPFIICGDKKIILTGDTCAAWAKFNTPQLMAIAQTDQLDDEVFYVRDATGDFRVTFSQNETKRQAVYMLGETRTGTISDYLLISAPYGNHTEAVVEATDGLELGSTSETAYRGDRGTYLFEELHQVEMYDFATRFNLGINF